MRIRQLCLTFVVVVVLELAHFSSCALIHDADQLQSRVNGLLNQSLGLLSPHRTSKSRRKHPRKHQRDDDEEGEELLPSTGLLEAEDGTEEEEASLQKVYSEDYSDHDDDGDDDYIVAVPIRDYYDEFSDDDVIDHILPAAKHDLSNRRTHDLAHKQHVPLDHHHGVESELAHEGVHELPHEEELVVYYHDYDDDYAPPTMIVKHVHDPFNCQDGLERWELEWPDEKKLWCCAHENLGCLSDHFDCQDGLMEFEKEWSQLKIEWCCHTQGLGCSKCDDYECPPDHRKLAAALSGSITCHLPPCKNTECCEMWGNMELRKVMTPHPTPAPHTHAPTPMPTVAPTAPDAFHCGSSVLDSILGWSAIKKEWCCINRNMGCKDVHPAEVGHADGRRRTSR